ncbi:MAG TPA: ABC transporter ATP-binding protein, partial [Anaerolineaceae bacterium]|nr:ABC transporter ATP-binding protein [Anaerolineaceae bacterium]
RQKLALARALLHEPPVLLLDEPTSAMDPESAFMVRNAIRSMRSTQRTIVLCTHNLTEAEDLADQIAIIQRGRIIFNDTSANLKQRLLGAPEYEARLAGTVNGWEPTGLPGVSLVQRSGDVLRFRVENPQEANPLLLEQLIAHRLPVVSFHEVPRSLEDAYLEAVRQAAEVSHA